MSSIEPSKLKVAELRVELQQRGLESKGVKAVLIERLEQALLAEAESSLSQPQEVEAAEAEGIADDNFEDTGIELAQEALPEAEQGFGEEFQQEDFGFSADGNEDAQDDNLLQGETGEEGEEADDQLLQDLDIPQAMEEAAVEPQSVEEPEAAPEAAPEAVPQEQEAEQAVEEQQEQQAGGEQQEQPAGESEAKPESMEQEQAPETQADGDKEKSADGDKKEDDDREKERKRDNENRNRDRRPGGRDRSPRRRTPPPVVMEEDDDIPDAQCVLSKYLSDLNLKVGKDGYNACPLSMEGFAYMWAGVKATHGASKGKVAFECKLESHADVRHLPPEENNRHVVRVGWSADATSLQLGEEALSYGYGGTAKASVNCKFENFGEKFGEGDVIGTFLDFEGEKPTISYTKNGTDLGVAFTIEEDLGGIALFPHIMTKNTPVEVNLGQKEEPFFPLKEGFTLIGKLDPEDSVRGPKPPATKKDCELLMMVGLPGSGKTTWAINACKEHTDKKYYILGTNLIMDKMKVMGLRRQRNYAGRWDKLMDLATKCLNRFFEVAARKRRNYILDQTNVYPSARRRKMRPFEGFSTKAIVLVPSDEELKKRVEKRTKEEGKDVPDHAVNEMKANFELPDKGVLFDEVEYVELKDEEAKPLVERYRKEGRDAGGLKPRFDRRPGGRDYGGYDRGGYRRDDRRGGYQGGYRSGGYDNHGGYDRGDRQGYGGGGYRGGYREGGWNRGGGGSGGGGGYGGSRGGSYGGSGGYRGAGGGYNSSRGSSGGYQNRGASSGYSDSSNYNRSGSSYNSGNQSSGGYNARQNQGSYGNKYGNQSNYSQNRQSNYNQQQSYGSGSSGYGSNQSYNSNSSTAQTYGSGSGTYGSSGGSSSSSSSNTGSSYNQSSSYSQQQQQPYQQQTQQTQQPYTNQQYQQYQQYYQQNPQYAQQYAQYYSNYGNYGSSGTSQ